MKRGKTYSENLPRVILVVGDAAVAHAAVGERGIHARVGHGHAAAARGLGAADEGVHGGVAAVLLLDLGVALAADVEEDASDDGGDGDNTDDNARSDAGDVGAALLAVVGGGGLGGRRRRGLDDGLDSTAGVCCGGLRGGGGGCGGGLLVGDDDLDTGVVDGVEQAVLDTTA